MIWKAAKTLFFALAILFFLAAAFLQYNDPDGWLWAIFYLVTAGLGGFIAFGKQDKPKRIFLSGHVILVLSLAIWVFTHTEDAFNPGGAQELLHEAGGLGIALFWNLILFYKQTLGSSKQH